MRQSLFAGRHLRASYRNVSGDFVIALLDRADEHDDFTDAYCLHRPRLRRSRTQEEF